MGKDLFLVGTMAKYYQLVWFWADLQWFWADPQCFGAAFRWFWEDLWCFLSRLPEFLPDLPVKGAHPWFRAHLLPLPNPLVIWEAAPRAHTIVLKSNVIIFVKNRLLETSFSFELWRAHLWSKKILYITLLISFPQQLLKSSVSVQLESHLKKIK